MVNISAIEFDQAQLVRNVAQVFDETGLSSGLLELEISESALMHDVEAGIKVFQSLKDMSVEAVMDYSGAVIRHCAI